MTEVDPPRSAAFRGIDGPIRPVGRIVLTPLDDGARTKYDFEFDFETHGLTGKMFGKVARRGAEKEIPEDLARLKAKLES
jgi:Polyketide cyclase / dehydrase and lipid transport